MSNYGKGDNRCGVCGGRMRLVNVTWINNFQTPEASLYDSSISSRSVVPVGARTSAQELMCTCCGLRAPLGYANPVSVEKKAKKVKEPLTKKQLKKSSPRFANGKDKTDGYEVRVIAVSGIHPELEKAIVGYRKTMEKKVKVDTTQLHIWKNLLKLENIARDENGQLKITDKCVWLADGTRIQLFTKKA